MKRIYLSIGVALLSASMTAQTSIVQRKISRIQTFAAPSVQINDKGDVQQAIEKAAPFYTDNFDNAALWTFNNAGEATAGWDVNSTYRFGFVGVNPPINSTSGGNNLELFNDAYQSSPIGNTYTATSTAIDLTPAGGSSAITLTFEQYGALFNDTQVLFGSVDGTTWVQIYDNSAKNAYLGNNPGEIYANPETVSVSLASLLQGSGATSLYLKFEWNSFATTSDGSYAWGWIIDDIALTTSDDNSITMNEDFMFIGAQNLEYGMVPVSQVSDITFAAKVTNDGAAAQPNTKLDVLTGLGTYSSPAVMLPVGASDSLVAAVYNPGTSVGMQNYDLVVSSDSTDSSPANNMTTQALEVTNYVYSRDNAGANAVNATGSLNAENVVGYSFGEDFLAGNIMDVIADETLYSMNVKLAGTPTVGGSLIKGQIWKFDGTQYTFLEETQEITVSSQTQIDNMIDLLFVAPVDLFAGDDVLLLIGSTDTMNIAQAQVVQDNGSALFSNDGGLGFGRFGTMSAFVVRMDFEPQYLNITNKEEGISLGNNVPNPFNTTSTINFELNNSENVVFTITDMTGKIVETRNMGRMSAGKHNLTLNANNFASGVYYYTLNTGKTQLTNKMIIQK